jgi:Neuraminidase (sialidase)
MFVAESKQEAVVAKKLLAKQGKAKKGHFLKIDNSGKRVIQARKRMSTKELELFMTKTATKVMREQAANIDPDWDEEKANAYLSEKIYAKMLSDGKVTKQELQKFMVVEEPDEPSQSEESASSSESESE